MWSFGHLVKIDFEYISTYKDSTERTLPCYVLTKTECLYIATKFSDEACAKPAFDIARAGLRHRESRPSASRKPTFGIAKAGLLTLTSVPPII